MQKLYLFYGIKLPNSVAMSIDNKKAKEHNENYSDFPVFVEHINVNECLVYMEKREIKLPFIITNSELDETNPTRQEAIRSLIGLIITGYMNVNNVDSRIEIPSEFNINWSID